MVLCCMGWTQPPPLMRTGGAKGNNHQVVVSHMWCDLLAALVARYLGTRRSGWGIRRSGWGTV